MELRTDRLLLRPIANADAEYVFRGLSHPDVTRYYAISFETPAAAREQMEWFARLVREGAGGWWAICSPDGAVFMGAVGLYGIVKQHRRGELGFWLLPEHWGRGIMGEALPPVLEHGFFSLDLHRIEAEVETENEASRRLLVKHGFQHEGTLRDREIKNGRTISLDVFARLGP